MSEKKAEAEAEGEDGVILNDGFSVVDSVKNQDNGKVQEQENKDKDSSSVHDTLDLDTVVDLDMSIHDDKGEEKVEDEGEKKIVEKNIEGTEEKPKVKPKGKDQASPIWVSNIGKHIKATDLKKHFSEHGRVLTAKVVTNGKSLFGYLCMASAEVAAKCVKELDNTMFEGRKIVVSTQRPDCQKKEEKNEKVLKKPEGKKEEGEKKLEEYKRQYEKMRMEFLRMKRHNVELERRIDAALGKCRMLDRENKSLRFEMKKEKKRYEKEIDILERKVKVEQDRLEGHRVAMGKELEEAKRLKEQLKMRLEEFKSKAMEQHKMKSRSRSPRSRFKVEEKKRRWTEERVRTPPPPPKLSEGSRKRVHDGRHYYEEKKGRKSPGYEFSESRGRHRELQPEGKIVGAAPRTSWPGGSGAGYQEVTWRGQGQEQQYQQQQRFSTGYQVNSAYSSSRDQFYQQNDYKHYDTDRKY